MTITLLSTFLIAAGVSNAIAAEYVFLELYTSAGCNEADAVGSVTAYAIGMCYDKKKMSAGLNGNFTFTQFEDDDCKTEAKVNPCIPGKLQSHITISSPCPASRRAFSKSPGSRIKQMTSHGQYLGSVRVLKSKLKMGIACKERV